VKVCWVGSPLVDVLLFEEFLLILAQIALFGFKLLFGDSDQCLLFNQPLAPFSDELKPIVQIVIIDFTSLDHLCPLLDDEVGQFVVKDHDLRHLHCLLG